MKEENRPQLRFGHSSTDAHEITASWHYIAATSIRKLSTGGGDNECFALLRQGQKSKRLILIRMLFEAIEANPATMGSLPAVHSAWNLLGQVQHESPAAFDKVLMHPSTGVWAAHALRRLRGVKTSSAPLWQEVGYFHTLSAAAAIHAGLEFDTRVPSPDGRRLHFPSLGTVLSPQDGRHAACPPIATVRRTGQGSNRATVVLPTGTCVEIPESPESPTASWRPLPQVRTSQDRRSFRLTLDDVDPYAPFVGGRHPVSLSKQHQRRWQAMTADAWKSLIITQPDTAENIAEVMCSLVPLEPTRDEEPYSATSPEAYGSAMIQLPRDATSLTVSLIHEFQHAKLGALLDLITLVRETHGSLHYAPWRLDPRPTSGLLQGAYAYMGIVAFWRRFLPRATGTAALRAQFNYARWRRTTLTALDDLSSSGELTELGTWFVANMRNTLAMWCEEPLPQDAENDAAIAAEDHLGMWLLRNRQSDASDVELLSANWKHACPTIKPGLKEPVVRADVLPHEKAMRSELLQLRWENPERYESLLKHPESMGVTSIDVALADRDFATALSCYRQQVANQPDTAGPWIGLGLAAKGCGKHTAAEILLGRPELVRAVFLRLAEDAIPVDPLDLAEWIGRAAS